MKYLYILIFALLLIADKTYAQYDYIPTIFPEAVLAEIKGGYTECRQSRHHFKNADTASFIRSQEDVFYYDTSGKIIRKYAKDLSDNEIHTLFFYNQAGDLAKKEMFIGADENKTLSIRCYYNFDDHGNLIHFAETNNQGDTVQLYKFETTYQDDQLVNLSCNVLDGLDDVRLFQAEIAYDSAGNKILEIIVDKDSMTVRKVSFKYDSVNRVIEKVSYASNNLVRNFWEYEYSDARHRLKSTRYETDGEIVGVSLSKFDVDGNLRLHTQYDASMFPWARFAYSYLK